MYQFPTKVHRPEHVEHAEPDETYLRLAIALAVLAIDKAARHENDRKPAPELTASIVYLAANGVCTPRYVLV